VPTAIYKHVHKLTPGKLYKVVGDMFYYEVMEGNSSRLFWRMKAGDVFMYTGEEPGEYEDMTRYNVLRPGHERNFHFFVRCEEAEHLVFSQLKELVEYKS
jgi:hypothetical protein